MLYRAVVPHQQVSTAPLVAINEGRFDDVLSECGNQRLGFFCLDALDTGAIVAHDIEAFPSGQRMRRTIGCRTGG